MGEGVSDLVAVIRSQQQAVVDQFAQRMVGGAGVISRAAATISFRTAQVPGRRPRQRPPAPLTHCLQTGPHQQRNALPAAACQSECFHALLLSQPTYSLACCLFCVRYRPARYSASGRPPSRRTISLAAGHRLHTCPPRSAATEGSRGAAAARCPGSRPLHLRAPCGDEDAAVPNHGEHGWQVVGGLGAVEHEQGCLAGEGLRAASRGLGRGSRHSAGDFLQGQAGLRLVVEGVKDDAVGKELGRVLPARVQTPLPQVRSCPCHQGRRG